jgi:hypothetical protein
LPPASAAWAPNCGDRRIDRIDQATNRVTADIAATVGDSDGGIAANAATVALFDRPL